MLKFIKCNICNQDVLVTYPEAGPDAFYSGHFLKPALLCSNSFELIKFKEEIFEVF